MNLNSAYLLKFVFKTIELGKLNLLFTLSALKGSYWVLFIGLHMRNLNSAFKFKSAESALLKSIGFKSIFKAALIRLDGRILNRAFLLNLVSFRYGNQTIFNDNNSLLNIADNFTDILMLSNIIFLSVLPVPFFLVLKLACLIFSLWVQIWNIWSISCRIFTLVV